MNPEIKCNQKSPQCKEPPVYRFTWPGKDEAYICEKHAINLQGIAHAIGMHIQLIPLGQ